MRSPRRLGLTLAALVATTCTAGGSIGPLAYPTSLPETPLQPASMRPSPSPPPDGEHAQPPTDRPDPDPETPTAPTAPPTLPWVGTWATAASANQVSFSDQTLRQVVHTSIGGDAARVQLSNVFGAQPLTLSSLFLAKRGAGMAADGPMVAITFAGSDSITLAPGAAAVSDPAAFTVPPQSDILVSLYIAGRVASGTCHPASGQTHALAAGNVSNQPVLSRPTSTTTTCFLTNLDVQNSAAEGAVVAFGASVTDGHNAEQDRNHRWPDFLAARLADAGRQVGVLNAGISGNRLLQDGSGPSALRRFARDALAQPGAKWVIVSDDPINDVGITRPQPSAEQLIGGLKTLVDDAHRAGLKIICFTLSPFEGAGYWTPEGEARRAAVNDFLRSPSSGCDMVVEQDRALHDPSSPTRFRPAYDSGDHLHPNDQGMQAIADAIDLRALR